MSEQEIAEVKTRRIELQPHRTLPENLADLPQGCDWCGKRDRKGKTFYLCCYKLQHDSQAAIPLIQMSSERATSLYDLADSAYDAEEIKAVSERLRHVSSIDPNLGAAERLNCLRLERLVIGNAQWLSG